MKISYDAQIDALYIQLRPLAPGKAENRELGEGIIADFGPDGLLAGIEILDASRILGQNAEQITVELSPVKERVA